MSSIKLDEDKLSSLYALAKKAEHDEDSLICGPILVTALIDRVRELEGALLNICDLYDTDGFEIIQLPGDEELKEIEGE